MTVNPNESPSNEAQSLFNRFKLIDIRDKKLFKTKLLKNKEFIKCDLCGERIKIGTMSLYCCYFNIIGHYDHVIDFVHNNIKLFK